MDIINGYKTKKTTQSLIRYHFVFCPRYKRKIFLDPEVVTHFKIVAREVCNSLDIEIISVKCCDDYVYLYVDSPPTLSPADIMSKIKYATSKELRKEFKHLEKLYSFWTRSYLVSTEAEISKVSIEQYVEQQKTRG